MKDNLSAENKKYIICDVAEAKWGKTTTLKRVINMLERDSAFYLMNSIVINKNDMWCHFLYKETKNVVVSTIGDPSDDFYRYLRESLDTQPEVIVAACRPSNRTQNAIYNAADQHKYEIIWFKNFRFDNRVNSKNKEYKVVKKAEAKSIVEMIKELL